MVNVAIHSGNLFISKNFSWDFHLVKTGNLSRYSHAISAVSNSYR